MSTLSKDSDIMKPKPPKTEISQKSEYEFIKEHKLKSEGIIYHPTPEDMNDKNDYIFL